MHDQSSGKDWFVMVELNGSEQKEHWTCSKNQRYWKADMNLHDHDMRLMKKYTGTWRRDFRSYDNMIS